MQPRMLKTIVPCLIMSVCVFTAGCGGSISQGNYEKIKADGTEDMAAVEKIMDSKGTEVPQADWEELGLGTLDFLKGKVRYVKGATFPRNFDPDEKGHEIKMVRWGDGNKYIVVAILEEKAVWKGARNIQ